VAINVWQRDLILWAFPMATSSPSITASARPSDLDEALANDFAVATIERDLPSNFGNHAEAVVFCLRTPSQDRRTALSASVVADFIDRLLSAWSNI
jgi:hypothetical protein